MRLALLLITRQCRRLLGQLFDSSGDYQRPKRRQRPRRAEKVQTAGTQLHLKAIPLISVECLKGLHCPGSRGRAITHFQALSFAGARRHSQALPGVLGTAFPSTSSTQMLQHRRLAQSMGSQTCCQPSQYWPLVDWHLKEGECVYCLI